MTDQLDAFVGALTRRSTGLIEGITALDKALVPLGWPAISPWWWTQIKAFYQGRRLGCKRLVARVGRRGGKSSTICRLAVAEALYGNHVIQPGDVGAVVFVSVKLSEARARLSTVQQILDAIKEPYNRAGDEIQLMHRRIVFRAYPANFRTSVGFTGIAFFADEVSRWRDEATGANPATHVFASIRPSLATMPNAIEVVVSSPWATLDYHYDLCKIGTTAEQWFCEAPSWVANPTLTEQRCLELEPDEATRAREYGAVPMTSDEATFFDSAQLERAAGAYGEVGAGDILTAGADMGFVTNSATLAIVAKKPNGTRVVIRLDERKPSPGQMLKPTEIIHAYAKTIKAYNISNVVADRHYNALVFEILNQHGVTVFDAPTQPETAYVATRVLLAQNLLVLPNDQQLLRDLKEIKGKPMAGGRISIQLPRRADGSHADRVSALVLALWSPFKGEPVVGPKHQFDKEYELFLRAQKKKQEDDSFNKYEEESWYD